MGQLMLYSGFMKKIFLLSLMVVLTLLGVGEESS
jgi:hypothetical protein